MTRRKRINTYADQSRQVLRMVTVRADTVNTESRSVEVVIATETPVERFDSTRNAVVAEVLRMDGAEFRSSRRQLPIVDSHDRSTTRNVYGSVRNIRTEGSEMIGEAVFARDAESQSAFEKVVDGHLTDFSITASVNELLFIERGDSVTIGGNVVQGPADIVTRWQPSDASLVAAGADSNSTVRSSLQRSYEINPKDETMTREILEALIGRGMPSDLDGNEAMEWAVAHIPTAEPIEETPTEEPTDDDKTTSEETEAEPSAARSLDSSGDIERALTDERVRIKEIRSLCDSARLQRAFAEKLCDDGDDIDTARKKVLDEVIRTNKSVGSTVNVTGDGRENLQNAIRDGLIMRSNQAAGLRSAFSEQKPAANGAEDFQAMPLLRLAERTLESQGVKTDRMAPRDIALTAMGHKPTLQRLRIVERAGEAYHTTGMFGNLLLDAANKTLIGAYMEAPQTWEAWARRASSVADFKAINRVRFSESADLIEVPENTDYAETPMSDEKESYSVAKFGRMFSVTWETIVNDDLDGISRVPAMHGNAARRTQNKKVYEVLTDNANMADGTALFDSGHSNVAGSGGALSVTTLNAAFLAFRTQTGVNSGVTINVTPRYLIVPAAIEATALELLNSVANPAVGGDTTGSSGVTNIYGPTGSRNVQVVADPVLDGNSATQWYLAADSAQIDTVELSFLQGEETPVLETEFDFDKDVWKYKIRQTFGVKAIDWRGLYRNAGA